MSPIFEGLNSTLKTSGSSIKDTIILVFPNNWSSKYHQEIKSFLLLFLNNISQENFLHQSTKVLVLQFGTKFAKPERPSKNTKEVRMCWILSSSWSQRWHLMRCGSPLLSKRSVVQQWFQIANQITILHFPRSEPKINFKTKGVSPWYIFILSIVVYEKYMVERSI